MLYRMKQNAVGLASICILSTGVLLMISMTVSIYFGMNDIMVNRYPYDTDLSITSVSEEECQTAIDAFEKAISDNAVPVDKKQKKSISRSSVISITGRFRLQNKIHYAILLPY